MNTGEKGIWPPEAKQPFYFDFFPSFLSLRTKMYEWPGLESKEKVKEERKESKHVFFQRSIFKFVRLSVLASKLIEQYD